METIVFLVEQDHGVCDKPMTKDVHMWVSALIVFRLLALKCTSKHQDVRIDNKIVYAFAIFRRHINYIDEYL